MKEREERTFNDIEVDQLFQSVFNDDSFLSTFLLKLPITNLQIGKWTSPQASNSKTLSHSKKLFSLKEDSWTRLSAFDGKVDALPKVLGITKPIPVAIRDTLTVDRLKSSFVVKSEFVLDKSSFSYADAFVIFYEWTVTQSGNKSVKVSMRAQATFSKWIPLIETSLQSYVSKMRSKWLTMAEEQMKDSLKVKVPIRKPLPALSPVTPQAPVKLTLPTPETSVIEKPTKPSKSHFKAISKWFAFKKKSGKKEYHLSDQIAELERSTFWRIILLLFTPLMYLFAALLAAPLMLIAKFPATAPPVPSASTIKSKLFKNLKSK